MTAVIYARYSSDSQREASIEGQLRDCKDYAEKNGITVVGTYIDRAYSAKTDDRPDFQRMIKDSGKKIFDVVLVWKLDRFARNRFDAVNYKYQLEKNGVHLVSVMEPISQGPEGIMVESMLIGMAEYYSAELALKVARGERENALQCKYNGGVVPLGFTIGKEDRLYHIDPETAPIVQEIFTRYANGEPAEKIAASLNERGLRTRTGKPFVKNSFFQIFRNRRYIGEYRYKDIVTPGGIPAIVDEDLFDRVQQRFEQNRIAHGRPAKEDVSYLLTTKLFCGKCGTLMGGESGTSHMGNTYYYYKCGNAKRHGKAHCDLKAIRKEPLERFVVDTAIKVIFNDEIIERLIDLVMEAQQKENTRLPVLKDQLRDTEKRLANLLEAIEQGILTPTTKQRLDELEARKEALNTSILEEELKKPVLTREWIRFWLEKFRKGDVGSTEHQRQIIDTFVNSVYVFDDRVVLNFNFTDDAKTVTREEVLGSSAVDNAPPKKHEILRLVLFLLPDGAISLVQFLAHLLPNLFAPLVIDLRVDCEGRTGLCVSGFCGYCRHANLRVGQEDAHKSVPKHMRMQPFNACPLSNPANQCAVAIRVDRKSVIVADHEVRSPKGKERGRILGTFLIKAFLPTSSHQFFLGLPILIIFFEEVHVLWSNVHIADVAFLCGSQLVAIIFEYQKRFRNMYGAFFKVDIFPCQSSQFATAHTGIEQGQNDYLFQHGTFL